jgi:hypothetical protein
MGNYGKFSRLRLSDSKASDWRLKPIQNERASASVNREFEMPSRIFTLAMSLDKADSNPCVPVKKFKLDNERYRYLVPDEEAAIMEKLDR